MGGPNPAEYLNSLIWIMEDVIYERKANFFWNHLLTGWHLELLGGVPVKKTTLYHLWIFQCKKNNITFCETFYKRIDSTLWDIFRSASISSTMSVRPFVRWLVTLSNSHSVSLSSRSTWKNEENGPKLFFNYGSGLGFFLNFFSFSSISSIFWTQTFPKETVRRRILPRVTSCFEVL